MTFDSLQHAAAKQQIKVLGGVQGSLIVKEKSLSPVWILVERNVFLPSDNGLSVEKKTVVSMLVAEVSNVERGSKVLVNNEHFSVADVIENDGYVVKVSVRG